MVAVITLSFALILTACGTSGTDTNTNTNGSAAPNNSNVDNTNENTVSGELVVYSSRNENFVNPLLEKFTADTGIPVRAFHGNEYSVNKIEGERNNPRADIFISNDIGAMEYLRLEGLLQGFEPQGIETIEEKYRAEDNSWFGLSARSRVLMYNKDLMTEADLPQTIWELADDKYAGQFAITRGGNGSMVAHVSALRNVWGDDKTSEWLSAIKDNAQIIVNGHGDIRRAVGSGEVAFGLVNNYYYHQQLNEPTDNNVGVLYPDQEEGGIGVFVNAAGVALVNGAPNEANAKIFIEWLLQPENQKEFSYASMEVPINPSIEAISEAASINEYKTMNMPLRDLGKVWTDTKALIEKSGLDWELRN